MKGTPNTNIASYLICTILFSWLLWLPGVLSTAGIIHPGKNLFSIINAFNWIGGTSPSLIAFIFVFKHEGRKGAILLIKKALRFNLGFWYLPVMVIVPLVLICAHLLNYVIFGVRFPQNNLTHTPILILALFSFFFVLQVAEEFGWRGFALDRLMKRTNPILASIIVGCIWAIWHIPMFLSEGFGQYKNHLPYGQFFITLVLFSLVITWLQRKTKGSLVPAFVLHAFINLSGEALPLIELNDTSQGDYKAWIILNILLVVVVIPMGVDMYNKKSGSTSPE